MTDLSTKTAILTATFVFKSNQAVKLKLSEHGESMWIPMSQILTIHDHSDGEETDYLNLDPNSEYLWTITGWIALKLFDCDGWEELVELELSFLVCND